MRLSPTYTLHLTYEWHYIAGISFDSTLIGRYRNPKSLFKLSIRNISYEPLILCVWGH